MTTPTSPVPATKAPTARKTHRPPTAITSVRDRVTWRGGMGWLAAIATAVLGTVWAVSQRPREGTAASLSESTAVRGVAPPAIAATLEITPPSADLEVGESVALEAALRAGSGEILLDSNVAWETNDITVARVSEAGIVTGLAAGAASVTARVRGQAASADVRVRPPPEPDRAAAAPAARRQAVATVIVDPAEASMVPGATRDGVTGSSMIVVNPVPVASIDIMPPTASLLEGETLQFRASARSAGGSILDDRTITWSTLDPAILRVSPHGIATGVTFGTTTLTARHGNHRAEATVRVTAPTAAEPGPNPEAVRRDIETVLETFARAVESRSLAAVRRAYPGMTEDEAQAYAKLLPTVERLTMTLDGPLDTDGTRRLATGSAHYRYHTQRTFEQTFEYRAELDLVSGRWQLMSIRFQEP